MPRQRNNSNPQSLFLQEEQSILTAPSRCILPASQDAILIQEAPSGAILQANLPAQELFGRSLPELLGLKLRDLQLPPDQVRKSAGERRAKERLKLPHYQRKSGSVFPADIWRTFLVLKNRHCNLLMVRDATKRLREESSHRKEQSRNAFMGDIVHELRSPIAVIQGSIETLRSACQDPASQTIFFKFIEDHAKRMSGLVDQLLDFSARKSSTAKPAITPLAKVMWEIAAAFVPIAKRRRIALKIDIEPDLVVFANPDDLRHIYGNLLDNAIKFTPHGGSVEVLGRSNGEASELTISDSGPGIPSADLMRVFDRLFRSAGTRNIKGSGLGLAIVQSMVEANGGTVVADNVPGGGARFLVSLPSKAAEYTPPIPAR